MAASADKIRAELSERGSSRTEARAQAKADTEAIAKLAPRALAAGLTKTEVAQLSQLSRTALDALLAKS